MKFLKLNLRSFAMYVAMASCTLFLAVMCGPPDDDELSVDRTSLSFAANETGEQTVLITTDAPSVECLSTVDWIIPTVQGTTLLSVRVAPYSDKNSSRTGIITLSGGTAKPVTIVVTQQPKGSITLSQTSLTLEWNDTGNKTINVSTIPPTQEWSYVTTNGSWLTCSKNGNELIVRANDSNSGSQERKATITFSAGSADTEVLTVTQKGQIFTVSPSSVEFERTASTATINVTSSVNWSVSSSASWCTVSPSSGSNNGPFTIRATANSSTSSRSATVTVSGGGITRTINVTQKGTPSNTAQVRFRKLSNNANTYEMAVASTSYDELAYYQFSSSTATTAYTTIPAGNHYTMVNEGGTVYFITWSNSDTYSFQANRKYTFEYDGTNYRMYNDGALSAPEQNSVINFAPEQPIITQESLKRIENRTSIKEIFEK